MRSATAAMGRPGRWRRGGSAHRARPASPRRAGDPVAPGAAGRAQSRLVRCRRVIAARASITAISTPAAPGGELARGPSTIAGAVARITSRRGAGRFRVRAYAASPLPGGSASNPARARAGSGSSRATSWANRAGVRRPRAGANGSITVPPPIGARRGGVPQHHPITGKRADLSVQRQADQRDPARCQPINVQRRDAGQHMRRTEMQMHMGVRSRRNHFRQQAQADIEPGGGSMQLRMQHPVASGHRVFRQPRPGDIHRDRWRATASVAGRLARAAANPQLRPAGDSNSRSSTVMRPATSVPVTTRPCPLA